jgi:hypothetical protein
VLRWERVAVSAHHLWFQRGWGSTVHQVVLENIRDLSVEESEAERLHAAPRPAQPPGAPVGAHARQACVALPKTDAHAACDAVESVANMLRQRLQQNRERGPVARRPSLGRTAASGRCRRRPRRQRTAARAGALRAQAAAPRAKPRKARAR